tara:strand:+ start:1907 stop:2623 length:717 start_codon:yes stop_codon:yes gene_type:complete
MGNQTAYEPEGGLAVVIGATGGIGAALVEAMQQANRHVAVWPMSRAGPEPLDLTDEQSIAAAALRIARSGMPLRRVIVATGFLHGDGYAPEKGLSALDPAHMARAFAINTIGPALVMKHFVPLLPRAGRSEFAVLSARVGSIGDNRLGGWHSYRASKAALNQLLRTCAIETARRKPEAVCVALHPGTVDTGLSGPFSKSGLDVRPPAQAAQEILSVVDNLQAADTGGFFDHKGQSIDW